MHLTTAERRGALLVLALFALGAAHDLWRAYRPVPPGPPVTPPAAPAPAAPAISAPAARPPAARRDAPAGPVDLNRATVPELDELPGIGPVLAGRIVEYRERFGPFRTAEDLLAVRGIGPTLFERLRDRVRVGPAATAPGSSHDAGGSGP